jgi:putative transposase
MTASDVREILEESVSNIGMNHVQIKHRHRLLSYNDPCYISGELKIYLGKQGITYTRGAPDHHMNQGNIERSHRHMKNTVKLRNYYFPWKPKQELSRFLDYYNHRYHESFNNVTPADVYFGQNSKILIKRDQIKRNTLALTRKQNLRTRVA